MAKFITCDIGKGEIHVYIPQSKTHYKISTDDFLALRIPELNGHTIVIEDSHLRSQEEGSLAQTWKIDQLKRLKYTADQKNIKILCFPQKVTPKARKIASIGLREDLLQKGDQNDIESIAFYLQEFPQAYKALKEFEPIEYKTFQSNVSHIYEDRNVLTEDANIARNGNYGIKTDYEDDVSKWIKKYISVLASNLNKDTREWAKLEYNAKKTALKPSILNYTSDSLKFTYNVVNTILTPNNGLRLRSDFKKPPYWGYAKETWFAITPYHSHAGVTASNYKYHKRKAGSFCKKSMSLESKNAIKNLDDVREIREAMKESDRHLRDFWRTIRKMIVEDGLR